MRYALLWTKDDLPRRCTQRATDETKQLRHEHAAGKVTEDRIDSSARRLLREKFRLGLFDNPFVDADRADELVGGSIARAEGVAAQAAAHTVLKNAEDGPARLPLSTGIKVYVENFKPDSLTGRATIVDSPADADVAILRLEAPWEQRGEPGSFESYFHAGSLAFPSEEIERIRAIAATVPTVVDVYLDRPAILTELAEFIPSLLVNFGASDEAVLQVLFGEAAPKGRLPFDIPSSMEAVVANRPDVPFDTPNRCTASGTPGRPLRRVAATPTGSRVPRTQRAREQMRQPALAPPMGCAARIDPSPMRGHPVVRSIGESRFWSALVSRRRS